MRLEKVLKMVNGLNKGGPRKKADVSEMVQKHSRKQKAFEIHLRYY